MASRFEEDSSSDCESTEFLHPSPTKRSSIIPFRCVDVEAVESDGEGGDIIVTDESEKDENRMEDVMDDIIDDSIDSNDENELNHIQIRNKLNKELDDQNNEEQRQQLLQELLTPKSHKNTENNNTKNGRKRYYDLLTNEGNKPLINESSSSEDNSDYIDSSDESESDSDSETEMKSDSNTNSQKTDTKPKQTLSELSKLEFEKLLSHTMVNLALKLEENENPNMSKQINPFANMDEQISLDVNNSLNMSELVSFISDGEYTENTSEIINGEKINNPSNFENIIPFENSHNIMAEPKKSSSNHPSNLRKAKLNTITVSDRNSEYNTFINEEIRLAQNTMKHAITSKVNIERKNFAPPLSSLDPRVRKGKRGDNAGKKWFNMAAGKLTPQNKLHFLMLKYRHMLYREYKPPKVKGDFVPKYFQIGTMIEGPTEWYSARLHRKQRRSSWANEYLSDPSTKQWLEEKTRRAQRRIRRPGKTFWAPMRKLNVNNRYKLRKKILANRKKRSNLRNQNGGPARRNNRSGK